MDGLESGAEPWGRVRRPGGGRKYAPEVDPGLLTALLGLVEPAGLLRRDRRVGEFGGDRPLDDPVPADE
ncbi:hypothetical protein GCM10010495_64340 [Kitasatospora herbaricolor]|nr:hypothetical protein GCM10010495_64340 [Kitasatospora herbaricolor]